MANFLRPLAIGAVTLALASVSLPLPADDAASSADAGIEPIRDDDFALDFDPGEPLCIAFPRGRLAAGCDAALAEALVASTEQNTTASNVPLIMAFVRSTPTPWAFVITRSAPRGEAGEEDVDRLERELTGKLGSEGAYGKKKVEKGTLGATPYIRLEWSMGPQREGESGRRIVAYALYGGRADYMLVAAGNPSQAARIDAALTRSLATLKLTPPVARSSSTTPATPRGIAIVSGGLLIFIALYVRSRRSKKRRP